MSESHNSLFTKMVKLALDEINQEKYEAEQQDFYERKTDLREFQEFNERLLDKLANLAEQNLLTAKELNRIESFLGVPF